MPRLLPVALLIVLLASCSDSTAPLSAADAAFSFVVVGCNRVDKTDTLGNLSTANVAQLNRTFADIAALTPRPAFVFFAGDLVFGYTPDTVSLEKQLRAWRALYEASPLAGSGTELVAVPGNHETQNTLKVSYAAAERTWLRVMAPYVARGGNGPKAGGADNLSTDQSALSYSFDYKGTHFEALNSDPVGADWHVPVQWVASDLASAKAAGARHLFVIAHKPAYAYPTVPTDGLVFDAASRDALWSALNLNGVEAMYSAHNHLYFRSRPTSGRTWQVIAGNGGSKLETAADPTLATTGTYFGFTLTTIGADGNVTLKSFGRDVPSAGYTSATAASATVRDSADITIR